MDINGFPVVSKLYLKRLYEQRILLYDLLVKLLLTT